MPDDGASSISFWSPPAAACIRVRGDGDRGALARAPAIFLPGAAPAQVALDISSGRWRQTYLARLAHTPFDAAAAHGPSTCRSPPWPGRPPPVDRLQHHRQFHLPQRTLTASDRSCRPAAAISLHADARRASALALALLSPPRRSRVLGGGSDEARPRRRARARISRSST